MKRPSLLEAQIYRYQINDKPYIVFVGLLNEKPFEVFAGKYDAEIVIPTTINKGIIRKTYDEKGKRYDFIFKNSIGNVCYTTIEGINMLFTKEFKDFNIFLSFIIRSIVMEIKMQNKQSIQSLIDNLLVDLDYTGSLGIWKDLVIKVLNNYGTKSNTQQERPSNFY